GGNGGRNHGEQAAKKHIRKTGEKQALKKALHQDKFHVSSHLLEPRPFTDSGRGIFLSCVIGSTNDRSPF
ncbi:MAG: hypothetical protein WDA72_08550, partial [Desulfomonilia bacterium]